MDDARFQSAQAKVRYLAFYDERAKQWPVPSENRVLKTSYGQTFVRVSGPSDGEPLMLLPGLSATSLMWIPYIASWSRIYRTYALDIVGDAGRSSLVRRMPHVEDYLRWLDEVIDTLEL